MRSLKIFLLSLVSILVVLNGWNYLVGMSVERTALSSSYYHEMIKETALISELNRELQQALPELIMESLAEEAGRELSEQEKEQIRPWLRLITSAAVDLIDEEWVEDKSLLLIDDALAVARGEQEYLTTSISLDEYKEELQEKLVHALKTLPSELKERLEIPPDEEEAMVQRLMAEADLPDQIYLADLIAENGQTLPEEVETAVSTLQSYRGIYLYLAYIIFVLMFISTLLLAGTAGGMKWYGAALLFSSITFMAGIRFLSTLPPATIFAAVKEELPLSPELLTAILDFTVTRLWLLPLGMSALGLAMVLAGLIISKYWKPGQA